MSEVTHSNKYIKLGIFLNQTTFVMFLFKRYMFNLFLEGIEYYKMECETFQTGMS
jgi:hypothetical protein